MICLNRTMDGELLSPQVSYVAPMGVQRLPARNISSAPSTRRNRLNGLRAWMAAFLLIGAAFSLDARADYWFKVNDASQIQYFISGPQIYLRNLNSFDSTVLGCCYNYWVDISTDPGKAAWATLLAKMQTQQPIWIYVASQTVAGSVTVAWFG